MCLKCVQNLLFADLENVSVHELSYIAEQKLWVNFAEMSVR